VITRRLSMVPSADIILEMLKFVRDRFIQYFIEFAYGIIMNCVVYRAIFIT